MLDGKLTNIDETSGIQKDAKGYFCEKGGGRHDLPGDSLVSMNAWGFKPSIFKELLREFAVFLDKEIADPKSEFFLPTAVQTLISQGVCDVRVVSAKDKWFGITNPEDADKVRAAIAGMVADGKYPGKLF